MNLHERESTRTRELSFGLVWFLFDERLFQGSGQRMREKKKEKKRERKISISSFGSYESSYNIKRFHNDPGLLSKDPKYAKHIDGDRFVNNIDVRLHDPRVSISSNWRGGTCHRLVIRAGI